MERFKTLVVCPIKEFIPNFEHEEKGKNHIYVHGGDGLIKKGYDEATGMEFYQLFFKNEE